MARSTKLAVSVLLALVLAAPAADAAATTTSRRSLAQAKVAHSNGKSKGNKGPPGECLRHTHKDSRVPCVKGWDARCSDVVVVFSILRFTPQNH